MNKSDKDTIAAMGTKPGEAAIGIIKVSGKDSIRIAEKIFKARNKKAVSQMDTYTLSYGVIEDESSNIIDEVIVAVMKEPRSYTREDVVEINCHGGIASAKKIIELVIEAGARLAEPGEFTKRAFLNGRIDLSQAEAVIDLVSAKTEQSLKIAASNIKGKVKKEIYRLKEGVLEIIAQLDA